MLGIAGDPGSNRVLAFTSPGAGIIATLAWTGTNWAPFGSTAAPFFGRFDDPVVGAVGDSHRGRVLLQTDSLLWQVGGMPADVRDIGPSCGSPGLATPTLTSFGLPRIGDPGHSLDLRAAPASLGVLGLSLATATLSFGPGCDWRIGVGASLLVTMGPAGDRAVPMPIPDDPVLRGLAVFAQFGVLAPTATYGVLLSAPAQLTVGD